MGLSTPAFHVPGSVGTANHRKGGHNCASTLVRARLPREASLVSYTAYYGCDKHHDQELLGEEMVHCILQLIVHHERKTGQELTAGTQGQELKQNRRATLFTGLLPIACSVCF